MPLKAQNCNVRRSEERGNHQIAVHFSAPAAKSGRLDASLPPMSTAVLLHLRIEKLLPEHKAIGLSAGNSLKFFLCHPFSLHAAGCSNSAYNLDLQSHQSP